MRGSWEGIQGVALVVESLSNMCEVLGSVLSTRGDRGAQKPERSEVVFSGRALVCYEQGLRLPTLSSIK